MNKCLMIFILGTLIGSLAGAAKLIPDMSIQVQGVDVRNKKDQYLLVLGKENIVLEERQFKLYRIDGKSKKLVKQGQVAYVGEDLKGDTEAIYSDDKTILKIGRLVNSKAPKQVVVLKLKDSNQTYAFELHHTK